MQIHGSKEARVGIFVDMQNIIKSANSVMPYRFRMNFKEFMNVILKGRTLYCAKIYDVTNGDFSRQPVFDAMEQARFEVLTKPVQVFTDGTIKGDWDVGMVIDMVRIADKLDVVVLVTGDGDFVPAVEYLRNSNHCRVEGVSFMRTTNQKLFESFDSHIDLGALTKTSLFFEKKQVSK